MCAQLSEVLRRVEADGVRIVRFQWVGFDLIQRALVSTQDFLEQHLKHGIGIAMGMNSFNALDQMAEGGSFGPESSELRLVPDLDTYAALPYAPGTARLICELCDLDLKPSAFDARYALRRVVERARTMGFEPKAALEPEFYLLRVEGGAPTQPYREKFATTHSYDLLSQYLLELVSCLGRMGVSVERIKKEYGGSQIEPTIRYSGALKAADDYVTLRDTAKALAASRGLIASFMPKPFEQAPGSGLHLHVSLSRPDGENAFHDPSDSPGLELSKTAYHFVGGILEHARELAVLCTPTTNSYKRLRRGSWAPTHVFWGYDNRAAVLRIPSSTKGAAKADKRVEFRLGDPSANPYLYVAGVLAAGLDGVERHLEPPQPLAVDPAKASDDELERLGVRPLPKTLGEAIDAASSSGWLRRALGERLVEEYLKVRRSEWSAYSNHVCEWELKAYLETF